MTFWLSALGRSGAAVLMVAVLSTAPAPLLMRVAHRLPGWTDPKLAVFATQAVAFVLIFLLCGVRQHQVSTEPVRASGLRAGAWLVLGTLTLSLLVSLSIVLSGSSPNPGAAVSRILATWVDGFPTTGVAGRIALYCVLGPIFEEFLYRAFILGFLLQRTPTWFAFVLTTALFAVVHEAWIFGALNGVAYGLLYLRFSNIWLCIVVHGAHNLLSAGLAPLAVAYLHDAHILVPVEASLLPLQLTWLIAAFGCFAMFLWEVFGGLEEGPLRFMLRPRPALA